MKLKTLSLLLLLALLAIVSCKKPLPDPSPSAATPDAVAQAFARLKTQQERNFFEKNYVTNYHPFLLQTIKSRGPEEDSLVNEVLQHLLLMNQSNPFLMHVIDHFGYPVWNRSKIVTGVDNPAYRAVLTPYAKMEENQISGYSMAFPSPVDFTEWYVLIVHGDEIDTLIQAPASCEVTNLVWHVAQKLDFDQQLFGTQQLNLKEWFEGCMGDGDGFARTQQIQERCFTIDLGECVNTAFAPTEGQIEDRDPCGAGQVWISNIVSVGCGELGSSNAPIGGGVWIGTLGGGGGSTGGSTGGGGNGTSTSTNEETVIDLYSKYGECLLANPDIANAVWQKENSFPQDLSLIRQLLDKVLEMICSEGEGQYMTPEIFESEYNRALCEFVVQNPERILFSPLRYNTTFMRDCVLQAVFPPELYTEVMELKGVLGLNQGEVLWLLNNQPPGTANEIHSFLQSKNFDDHSKQAGKNILRVIKDGWLTGPYPELQRDAIIDSYGFPDPAMYVEYVTWAIILEKQWEQQHPGQTCGYLCLTSVALEAYWKAISGTVHTLLDLCGLIPVGGELCDGINGVLYLLEGDGVNATLSFAATIPIAGWLATGAKYALIAVTTADGLKKLKVTLNAASGLIEFSHYSSFRKMMGITDPNKHAHHLISWNKREHALIQRALQADEVPFHMNNPNTNGISIDSWRNQQNHPLYDDRIEASLNAIQDEIEDQFGTAIDNIDPNIVSQALKSFQYYLYNQVGNFPNLHLDDVPIIYP